jgi:hypothetical protein
MQRNTTLPPPKVEPELCPVCSGRVACAAWGQTPLIRWEHLVCRDCHNSWFTHRDREDDTLRM